MSRSKHLLVVCALLLGCGANAFAQPTGTLAGVLTDEQTGLPVAPGSNGPLFIVYACPPQLSQCNSSTQGAAQASPDVSGHYVIQNLAPGSYRVHVLAFFESGYISEIHPNIPCISADCTLQQGTPVNVAAGGTTTVDFALTKGGSIGGTVRRADTNAGVYRQLFLYNDRTSPANLRTTYTNFNTGAYEIPNLPPGNYYLRTVTADGSVANQYLDVLYPNLPCNLAGGSCPLWLGTPITVTTGATTTADFTLQPNGTIAGTITAADTGLPIVSGPGVTAGVTASAAGLQGSGIVVDAAGHYTINGLPPGRYYVKASVIGAGLPSPPPYRATYFGNVCEGCAGTPTPVDVTLGATTAGIDIALIPFSAPPRGSIAGGISTSITNEFLYSANCSRVAAYDSGGHLARTGTFVRPDNFTTWPSGYVIDDLPAGTYYVRFEDPGCFSLSVWGFFGGIAPDQTYGAAPCVTDDCDVRRGTPVTVTAGATTSGVDFFVAAGGSIVVDTGAALYDARGVRVNASRYFQPFAGFFGPSGPPSYVGLPDGTYYARTIDGRLGGGITCADCSATAGRPLVIRGANELVAGLTTPPRYTLSGVVRDAVTGAPLSTVNVELLDTDGRQVWSDTTDAVGRYEFAASDGSGQLVPGTYFVRTRNTRGYADLLYPSELCAGCAPVKGTPITIGTANVTGIDFSLPRGGFVDMRTLDPYGVPIQGQTMALFSASGQKVARVPLNLGGGATVLVAPGTYYARTEPASGYVMTGFDTGPCARGACDPTAGAPLDVTIGHTFGMFVAACTPGDISPSILASAVMGRPFRQVFRPSTPDTSVYVSSGRLPAGLTLDPTTGALAGTPTESGVFTFSVASVDAAGCAFVRQYTLQVAQCAFTLSADSATVGASGGAIPVTASDVCGYSTVTSQAPWIAADASSASASSPLTLTIGVNPDAASRVGTISIGRRVFTVRQAGQGSSAPFGNFETPIGGAQVSGSIAVSGWALDDVEVSRVRILRDAVAPEPAGALVFIGDAVLVEGARPDVERAFPGMPRNNRAGWGYLLLTSMLPNQGNGTFVLHAFADDAEGHATDLGTKTIVATNSTATVPFGAIDTPAQGETVSGAAYRNYGWALTPNPKFIPTDGSTIQVLIDGLPAGNPIYNLFRPDVAGLFPGLRNSAGPVGYRDLDTTALGEGVHTIAWIVTDNEGAGAGIGSRYFTVRNSADAQPAGLFLGPAAGRREGSLLQPSRNSVHRVAPLQALSLAFPSAENDACGISYAAYLIANGEVRDLPAGAAITPEGVFTWQPGPAFNGRYEFAVVGTSCQGEIRRQSVIVRVE